MKKNKARAWQRWRWAAAAVAVLLLLAGGAAWYACTVMTDKLVEVLMDDGAAEGRNLAGSVEGAAAVKDPSRDLLPTTGSSGKSSGGALAPQKESPLSSSSSSVTSGNKKHEAKSSDVVERDFTPEKLAAASNGISLKERLTIGEVVMKHWNAAELKDMSQKLSGGLTKAEKRELKQEALAKLSPEEYNKLVSIAKKLGMSRGKSYSQSLKEH